jgi:hypothetical protein
LAGCFSSGPLACLKRPSEWAVSSIKGSLIRANTPRFWRPAHGSACRASIAIIEPTTTERGSHPRRGIAGKWSNPGAVPRSVPVPIVFSSLSCSTSCLFDCRTFTTPGGNRPVPLRSYSAEEREHLTRRLFGAIRRKDRHLAGGDGVDGGDGRSETRRPGGEGRRGVREMH